MITLIKQIARTLCGAALIAAFLGAVPQNTCSAAPFSSPVDTTWDFISAGGGQKGIAFLTFSNDFTFGGYHFWAPNPPKKKPSTSVRSSGNSGRGDSSNTPKATTNDFVFGFAEIKGHWNYDNKGRVVGFFTVPLNVTSIATNYHAGTIETNIDSTVLGGGITNVTASFEEGIPSVTTNLTWPDFSHTYTIYNTNFTVDIGSAEKTNTVNFTGIVKPGRRMTCVASTTFGKTTYRGIPFQPQIDISGSWIGTKKEKKQKFFEFFDLLPTGFENIYYSTNDVAPGYSFSTLAIVSTHKRIGFDVLEGTGTNLIHRATSGPLKTRRRVSANTIGVTEALDAVSYNAFLQSAP